jgi:hypothetical protein
MLIKYIRRTIVWTNFLKWLKLNCGVFKDILRGLSVLWGAEVCLLCYNLVIWLWKYKFYMKFQFRTQVLIFLPLGFFVCVYFFFPSPCLFFTPGFHLCTRTKTSVNTNRIFEKFKKYLSKFCNIEPKVLYEMFAWFLPFVPWN